MIWNAAMFMWRLCYIVCCNNISLLLWNSTYVVLAPGCQLGFIGIWMYWHITALLEKGNNKLVTYITGTDIY